MLKAIAQVFVRNRKMMKVNNQIGDIPWCAAARCIALEDARQAGEARYIARLRTVKDYRS